MNKHDKTQLARMLDYYTEDTYRYDSGQDCIFWNWKPIEIRDALTKCLNAVTPEQNLNAAYTRITNAYQQLRDAISWNLKINPGVDKALGMITRAHTAILSDRTVTRTSTQWLRKQLESEDQEQSSRLLVATA